MSPPPPTPLKRIAGKIIKTPVKVAINYLWQLSRDTSCFSGKNSIRIGCRISKHKPEEWIADAKIIDAFYCKKTKDLFTSTIILQLNKAHYKWSILNLLRKLHKEGYIIQLRNQRIAQEAIIYARDRLLKDLLFACLTKISKKGSRNICFGTKKTVQ